MYNQKTGLFKEASELDQTDEDLDGEQVQRTGLMSQKSRREYEVASKKSNVTLVEFDQETDSKQDKLVNFQDV